MHLLPLSSFHCLLCDVTDSYKHFSFAAGKMHTYALPVESVWDTAGESNFLSSLQCASIVFFSILPCGCQCSVWWIPRGIHPSWVSVPSPPTGRFSVSLPGTPAVGSRDLAAWNLEGWFLFVSSGSDFLPKCTSKCVSCLLGLPTSPHTRSYCAPGLDSDN